MSKYMQDPDFLFSVLAMVVKKNGGIITITEEEMKDVSKGDLIGMYYEPKTGDLVLKQVEKEDMMKATSMVRDDVDKVYDN
jgi:S-adenosylhomocysteine hydrolase